MLSSLSRVFTEHRTLTPRLRALLKLYITPLVLLGGVLILMVYHFRGVLTLTTAQDAAFHGVVSYSQGSMALNFNQNAGSDRPTIMYNNRNLVTYSEWTSVVSADGVTQSLWNSYHGYSADVNKRQVYSTATGQNWQIIEVVTLVNDHTARVALSYVARGQVGNPPPQRIELDLAHLHTSWYNPTISGNTFTADVVNPTPGQPQSQGATEPKPDGVIHITISGPAVSAQSFQLGSLKSTAGPKGLVNATTQLTTRYTVTNPTVNVMMPLATETITFEPGQVQPIGLAPTPVPAS